jgi:hypothetical protein
MAAAYRRSEPKNRNFPSENFDATKAGHPFPQWTRQADSPPIPVEDLSKWNWQTVALCCNRTMKIVGHRRGSNGSNPLSPEEALRRAAILQAQAKQGHRRNNRSPVAWRDAPIPWRRGPVSGPCAGSAKRALSFPAFRRGSVSKSHARGQSARGLAHSMTCGLLSPCSLRSVMDCGSPLSLLARKLIHRKCQS